MTVSVITVTGEIGLGIDMLHVVTNLGTNVSLYSLRITTKLIEKQAESATIEFYEHSSIINKSSTSLVSVSPAIHRQRLRLAQLQLLEPRADGVHACRVWDSPSKDLRSITKDTPTSRSGQSRKGCPFGEDSLRIRLDAEVDEAAVMPRQQCFAKQKASNFHSEERLVLEKYRTKTVAGACSRCEI